MNFLIITLSLLLSQPTECPDSTNTFYKVQSGDHLTNISSRYSESFSWELIYIYNSHIINNPNKIFPEQQLYIPKSLRCNSPNEFTEVYISVRTINEEYIREFTLEAIQRDIKNQKYTNLIESYRRYVKTKPKPKEVNYNLTGLIYDNTVTKSGFDFYSLFYQKWEDPETDDYYDISIEETPGPSMGTIIRIKVNDTTVYSNRIRPNYEEIRAKSEEGVQYTLHYINNFDYSINIY